LDLSKLSIKDIAYVVFQFMLFGLYLWEVNWLRFRTPNVVEIISFALMILGIAIALIAVLQLNKNLSPFPRPKDGGVLITNRLFKYIRHPIYTGILISAFAYAIYLGSGFKILIGCLLLVVFYFKTSYEEKLLEKKFSDYQAYKKSTNRFLPKIF
jgi:protein-S-isoprenylcysteine O-methyltransferase Ste14